MKIIRVITVAIGWLMVITLAIADGAPLSSASGNRAAAPDPAGGTEPSGTASYPLAAYSALGSTMARNSRLVDLGWTNEQISAFVDGIRAAFHGRAYPPAAASDLSKQLDHEISDLDTRRRRAEITSPSGLAHFIKATRKTADLRETDSGLCFRFLSTGVGVRPRPQDTVVISMECRTADDMNPVPALAAKELHVKVRDLLPGLAEGLQMMTVDSRTVFLIPPKLSFGDGEWPQGLERGLPLVFIVSLHSVIPAP